MVQRAYEERVTNFLLGGSILVNFFSNIEAIFRD